MVITMHTGLILSEIAPFAQQDAMNEHEGGFVAVLSTIGPLERLI